MHGLEIEIPQQALRLLRAFIQRRQHRGLVVIDVVARRPAEGLLLRRRQGTIPLDAALLAGLFGNERFRGAVAEGLVAAAVGVVVGRDRIQVQMREVIAEVPGPYTRHPERGQCLNFMEAQLEAFSVSERIDIVVDRPGAIPGHQQRHALVQIVDHLRMPLTEHAEHRLGGLVNLLVRDRKSTRLNSSHVSFSYAVFCLKKKKRQVTALLLYEIKKQSYIISCW